MKHEGSEVVSAEFSFATSDCIKFVVAFTYHYLQQNLFSMQMNCEEFLPVTLQLKPREGN